MEEEQSSRDNGSGASAFIGLLILGLIVWWVFSTFIHKEWIGIYMSRTTNDIYTMAFESREQCADWLEERRLNPGVYENYECGANCQPPTTPLGLYKCAESF